MSHQTLWWPFSFLLRPFHRPGVYVPQPTPVPLIHRRITPSSWIIQTGAQGIHPGLVIVAMSIECEHYVCVIGLVTSCMVKSSSGAGRRRKGNHPQASSCKNCPRLTCREANTFRSLDLSKNLDADRVSSFPWACECVQMSA